MSFLTSIYATGTWMYEQAGGFGAQDEVVSRRLLNYRLCFFQL
jgi:hypothetical protein